MTEPRVYRASSLGYSLEALVAPHLGFEPVDPPEFLQAAYDEGNRLEPIILETLANDNSWVLWDEQKEITMEVIPGVASVVGHVDAFGAHEPLQTTPAIIEVKTMADKSWREFTDHGWDSKSPLIEKYKWQASAYMLTIEMPHVLVAWNKAEDCLSFTYAREPFYTISDIASKLQQAEDFIARGVVPDGCEDFPCPFYYLHPPKDEVAKVEDESLEELLAAWLEADKEEKAAKAGKDTFRAQILALAGDQAAAKVKGECGVTVETYWQNESTYTTTKREGWVSRISGPRKPRGGNGD